MPEVYREGATIVVSVGDDEDRLDPAEARATASALLEHVTAAEVELEHNRALCASEGHDWTGYDTRVGDRRIHREYCRREGCEEVRESEGWRQEYPPKKHRLLYTAFEIDCSGPSCPHCDAATFAEAIRPFLAEAVRGMEARLELEVRPDWLGAPQVPTRDLQGGVT